MRALIQRVSSAGVEIRGESFASIGKGFLVLLGVEDADDETDAEWLSGKISQMRIFEDEDGKMNRALADIDGEVLVVSQFTLHASIKKGNRPSFLRAAAPQQSVPLYESFCARMEGKLGKIVARGVFGADMKVALVNDGPVTIWLDSRDRE